jgi:hypothetical protein
VGGRHENYCSRRTQFQKAQCHWIKKIIFLLQRKAQIAFGVKNRTMILSAKMKCIISFMKNRLFCDADIESEDKWIVCSTVRTVPKTFQNILCTTVQYSTVQYSTVQYSTVQYCAVQYSTVQNSTVQYSTVQYSTVQYSTVQYSTPYLSVSIRFLTCTDSCSVGHKIR